MMVERTRTRTLMRGGILTPSRAVARGACAAAQDQVGAPDAMTATLLPAGRVPSHAGNVFLQKSALAARSPASTTRSRDETRPPVVAPFLVWGVAPAADQRYTGRCKGGKGPK